MDWTEVFRDIGVSTIAIGAVGWVAQAIVSRWLDNRVELFREELKRESTEHQVRFESLHSQRAECLLAIWRALKRARADVNAFTSPAQMGGKEHQDTLGDAAGKSVEHLYKCVFENSIFFAEPLGNKLVNLARGLDSLWFGAFLEYKDAREAGRNPYIQSEAGGWTEFAKAWHKLQDEIDPIVKEVEAEFRALLGVSADSSGPKA